MVKKYEDPTWWGEFRMISRIRCFIAIDIDDPVLVENITRLQNDILSVQSTGIKMVEPQNIHLTIRFLGEIPLSTVKNVEKILNDISYSKFYMTLEGVGAFPSIYNPRVIWIGVSEGREKLKELHSMLEPRIRKLGILPDHKSFEPHVTIARVKSRRRGEIVTMLKKVERLYIGRMIVDCIRLKRSTLTPRGPIYDTLFEKKFT